MFNDDLFFVSGWRSVPDNQGIERPFAAIFDSNGRMLREVSDAEPIPKFQLKGQAGVERISDALQLSIAESDGVRTTYLARSSSTGPVYAISSSGQLLHTIKLKAPPEKADLLSIKVSGGRLVAVLEDAQLENGTASVRIEVLDAASGRSIAQYSHNSWEIGDALACYDPRGAFTFLSSDESGKMELVQAAPK